MPQGQFVVLKGSSALIRVSVFVVMNYIVPAIQSVVVRMNYVWTPPKACAATHLKPYVTANVVMGIVWEAMFVVQFLTVLYAMANVVLKDKAVQVGSAA
jgi:ABC-type sugar transport system permease subunit